MTLVIDSKYGTPCPTCIIKSRCDSIRETVIDPGKQERAPIEAISFYEHNFGDGQWHFSSALKRLHDWFEISLRDVAVWTDAASNFSGATGIEFVVSATHNYLRFLASSSLVEAKRYIENSPTRVHAPLRRALACDAW